MTRSQRKIAKLGNRRRKLRILRLARTGNDNVRHFYGGLKVGQG